MLSKENNLKNKLALESEIKNLDWDEIKEQLSQFATSAPGQDFLIQLPALASAMEAKVQLSQIEECVQVLNSGVRPFAKSLDLFENWHLRLKKSAVLTPLEFKDLRHFLSEILALKETLNHFSSTFLSDSKSKILKADQPLKEIEKVFTLSGEIRQDASYQLNNLYREKESLWKQIHQSMDRLVNAFSMEPYLQDKYVTTREGRWVLPIRGGSQHRVKGLMHGHSQTKQTVYIEPEEIVPLNNRIIAIDWEIEQEIERILTELSGYFAKLTTPLNDSKEILFLFDCRLAQAQLSLRINGTSPEYKENSIHLIDLKHPLLALHDTDVVSNTIELNPEKTILLLSGPNAGGKTVLLKSIGLAAQMARCGLPICAGAGSHLPFISKLQTIIGDAQSVDHHLSTFAAHLKSLNEAAELKSLSSILLIDEICGSTDPEEGSALARSFIEIYEKNNIFAVITSHLGPLKLAWTEESKVQQGSMHYDEKSGRPSFQFIRGLAGESLAIQTAQRVGVSAAIIERAYSLLSPEVRQKRQVLDEVEKIKNELLSLREDVRKKEKEVAKAKEKYTEMINQFEREKQKELDQVLKKAQEDLQQQMAAAKAAETFKKFERLDQIKSELPQIIKGIQKQETGIHAISNADDFIKAYPPGTKVFVKSLNQDGLIQGNPNNRGEIPILSNSLRINVLWKDLTPPLKANNPTQRILNKSNASESEFLDRDRILDFRGKTVEDALSELELALDNGFRSSEERIKIIHGHGTEALKRALRAYLSRSVYVKKWKAGTPENGGDGITWVELGQDY